jgi:hypothetical protein
MRALDEAYPKMQDMCGHAPDQELRMSGPPLLQWLKTG